MVQRAPLATLLLLVATSALGVPWLKDSKTALRYLGQYLDLPNTQRHPFVGLEGYYHVYVGGLGIPYATFGIPNFISSIFYIPNPHK